MRVYARVCVCVRIHANEHVLCKSPRVLGVGVGVGICGLTTQKAPVCPFPHRRALDARTRAEDRNTPVGL